MDEQKLSIVTNKEDFFITIDHDGKIGVSISPENDANFNKQVYVNTNKQGELIEPKASWSTEYKENILEYLKKYQDIHAELITRSIEKLDEVAG
ncbi:hypothetical protein [Enterococcus massiliensis]|uniref:hypothetical protein n=1 Tax=Enterococcus massiliensis TaxID=1640685 RepID=UPI00065E0F6C|nr:hypothetical protein [Enterococcus massiliensis]